MAPFGGVCHIFAPRVTPARRAVCHCFAVSAGPGTRHLAPCEPDRRHEPGPAGPCGHERVFGLPRGHPHAPRRARGEALRHRGAHRLRARVRASRRERRGGECRAHGGRSQEPAVAGHASGRLLRAARRAQVRVRPLEPAQRGPRAARREQDPARGRRAGRRRRPAREPAALGRHLEISRPRPRARSAHAVRRDGAARGLEHAAVDGRLRRAHAGGTRRRLGPRDPACKRDGARRPRPQLPAEAVAAEARGGGRRGADALEPRGRRQRAAGDFHRRRRDDGTDRPADALRIRAGAAPARRVAEVARQVPRRRQRDALDHQQPGARGGHPRRRRRCFGRGSTG